jgi:hypothetical protein
VASEPPTQASRPPHQLCAPPQPKSIMPQHQQALINSNEANIQLSISSLNKNQIRSVRATAQTYNAPRTTLRDRRAGRPARRDCQPNSKKLSQLEEEVIVSYILNLDLRGFAPTYAAVRDMADKLLAARGAGQVGQKWPANFVKRTDSLRTRFNRTYDRQRALCEDPVLIQGWFKLVEQTKAKYGICDDDVYNFDEAGFMMGKITTQLVITGSERRGRPKTIQPGNREWVTLIAAINAAGWSVPPFLIFAGKYHLSAWCEGAEIPTWQGTDRLDYPHGSLLPYCVLVPDGLHNYPCTYPFELFWLRNLRCRVEPPISCNCCNCGAWY